MCITTNKNFWKTCHEITTVRESSEQSVGLAKTNKGADTSPVHRTTGTPRGQQVPEVAQTICQAGGGGGIGHAGRRELLQSRSCPPKGPPASRRSFETP